MTLKYNDTILDNQTTITIMLPDKITGPLQSLYVLHGLGDDGSAWQRKTYLETLVADYQVAVIIPSLPRSWYIDQPDGQACFSFLTHSLPTYLSQLLPLSPESQDHFIMGNSMGGFGTLKWLNTYPDFFQAAVVLSPLVDLEIVPSLMPDYRHVFLDEPLTNYQLTKPFKLTQTPIYWTIGTDDFLFQQNQHFLDKVSLNPASKVVFSPGRHDWLFWNQALNQALAWLPLKK
ncbi:acetyl esterase [Latilactobacillus curvatus]|uniref:Acetyl esterase n=1 Tax=Latilactobacillus curvatus TaxID=28038 RepID=A0AAC9UQE3_LATCU|nr:alpha/beta fold hydrolase [Latilactobacillus curvatus]ASN60876.1 acetyl esterase [Latilactobacillus curvatus]